MKRSEVNKFARNVSTKFGGVPSVHLRLRDYRKLLRVARVAELFSADMSSEHERQLERALDALNKRSANAKVD